MKEVLNKLLRTSMYLAQDYNQQDQNLILFLYLKIDGYIRLLPEVIHHDKFQFGFFVAYAPVKQCENIFEGMGMIHVSHIVERVHFPVDQQRTLLVVNDAFPLHLYVADRILGTVIVTAPLKSEANLDRLVLFDRFLQIPGRQAELIVFLNIDPIVAGRKHP